MRVSFFLSLLIPFVLALPSYADYVGAVNGDDPLVYYRLDESSGTTAANTSTGGSTLGAGGNGTYAGTFGLGAGSLVPTEPGNDAASFLTSMNSSLVNIANPAFEGIVSARTTELWFNANDVNRGAGTEKQVLWEEGGATRGFNMYLFGGEIFFHAWNNLADDVETWGINDPDAALANPSPGDGTARAISVAVNSAETYHAVLVYDDVGNPTDGTLTGTLTAYLNGIEVGFLDDLGRLYAHTDDAAIGGVDGSTLFHDGSRNTGTNSDPLSPGLEHFDGIIDDVSIYGVALTAGQVQDHYLQAVPEPSSMIMLFVSAGGIAGYWQRRRKAKLED